MAEWQIDLKKWCKKQGVKIEEVRNSYAYALYSSIMRKTPVKTGRARGNWNIGIGHEDSSIDMNLKMKRGLKYKESDVNAKEDETIYISNNLPYIQKLEYGSSKQAPNGMGGLTVGNSKNILDAVIRSKG